MPDNNEYETFYIILTKQNQYYQNDTHYYNPVQLRHENDNIFQTMWSQDDTKRYSQSTKESSKRNIIEVRKDDTCQSHKNHGGWKTIFESLKGRENDLWNQKELFCLLVQAYKNQYGDKLYQISIPNEIQDTISMKLGYKSNIEFKLQRYVKVYKSSGVRHQTFLLYDRVSLRNLINQTRKKEKTNICITFTNNLLDNHEFGSNGYWFQFGLIGISKTKSEFNNDILNMAIKKHNLQSLAKEYQNQIETYYLYCHHCCIYKFCKIGKNEISDYKKMFSDNGKDKYSINIGDRIQMVIDYNKRSVIFSKLGGNKTIIFEQELNFDKYDYIPAISSKCLNYDNGFQCRWSINHEYSYLV